MSDAKWYANWVRMLPAESAPEKMRNLEAADLIESLAAELEQVKRERDAAVEDIKIAAIHLCDTCKHRMPDERCRRFGGRESDAIVCGMYEWRGAKMDEGELIQ